MTTIHITANSRLSSTLKQQAIQSPDALSDQSNVVETPQVMTLVQWWQQWHEGCLLRGELDVTDCNRKVLNRFESQWLWEQILQQELDARETQETTQSETVTQSIALLNVAATAKQLQQAWALSQEWFDDDWLETSYRSDEVRLFQQCQVRYLKALDEKGWWDDVLEQKHLLTLLKQGKGQLPQRFCLHGFDELTPFFQQWKTAVEARGVACQRIAMPQVEPTEQPLKYTALDEQDEVQQVAFWCVEQWQQLSKTKSAHAIKIGVVSPNIEDYKAPLSHRLDEQLSLHGLQSINIERTGVPFYNFSLGTPLASCPLVHNALLSLQLFLMPNTPCSYNDWSQWLTSAYTVGDWVQRQQADAGFRQLQWATLSWPKLLETKAANALPERLKTTLKTMQQRFSSTLEGGGLKKLTLSEFVAAVWQTLSHIEWATERTLNSDEFQQKKTFKSAITQFSMLTEMAGKQSISRWLSLFKRFLSEQLHQSQSKGLQPIQIMGTLEAGGQTFDALWVLGLTDSAWPSAANPNPFLPNALQREQRSLRCDAQRELEYAQQVTYRLIQCAPQIVCSYAKQQGDAEQLPSPLMEQLSLANYAPKRYQSLALSHLNQQGEQPCLTWRVDAQGPEMAQGQRAPGGSGLLQAQSQCPLMAFMDYRLGAKYGLQSVEEGLQSSNQGTLVHAILEGFWQETQTQVAMLVLEPHELDVRLKQHIEQSFSQLSSALDPAYMQLEKQRLFELCQDWLMLEKERPAFSVVATEQHYEIELNYIRFKLVIDRVDEVDGKYVIIDYKTGSASIGALLKTPTKAPQLAVYLHAVEQDISGIGYGLLHSDDGVKISALVEDDGVFAKDRSVQVFAKKAEKEGGEFYDVAWNDFLEHLKEQVWMLAEQIQLGDAPMVFERETDIQYANCKLALRLPEVKAQQESRYAE